MKSHTQAFKDTIKQYGREFTESFYTYTTVINHLNGDGENSLWINEINSVKYSYDSNLLKSRMTTLVIDSLVDIPIGTKIRYRQALKVNNLNENMNIGIFYVNKVEQQKDKKSYLVTCYDSMIKTMVDYTTPIVNGNAITYPITIRNYLSAICSHLGITFASSGDTFTNYDKEITSEHYLDSDGNSLGYTFRDVLDDLAECIGGFIIINPSDELEIKYISQAVGTKNIFNIDNVTSVTNGILSNGLITTNSATATSLNINPNFSTKTLSSGKTYYMSAEIRRKSGSGSFNKMNDSVANWTSVKKPTLSTNFQKYVYKTTLSSNRNYNKLLFQFSNVSSGVFEIKNIMISESEDTTYEPYYETINEEFFNDKGVTIKEKYGPINKLVTNIGTPRQDSSSITNNGLCEIDILDNPILDQTNGDSFLDGIFNKIKGLEYYLNDFQTKGILYYEIGDKYNVSIDNNIYTCLMLNDNITRTTGLKENIYTKEPIQNEAPYKYENELERTSRNAYIIANKSEGKIEQVVNAIGDNGEVTTASIVQSINDSGSQIKLNADKVYINGVTFDQNQKMTMTDGDIEITDTGGQDLSDSHIIIKSVDDTRINYLTSYLSRHSYIVTENGTNYRYGTNVEGTNIRVSKTNLDNNTLLDHTTLTPSYLFATLTENGHTSETIIGSKRILTRLDNTETFDLDTTTGNTTIGGTLDVTGNATIVNGNLTTKDTNNNTTFEVDGSTGLTTINNALRVEGNVRINNELNTDNANGEMFIGYRGTNYIYFIGTKIMMDSNGDIYSNGAKIIERTTNNNGTYIKYSDGTIICCGRIDLGPRNYNRQYGYIFIPSTGVETLDFPYAFGDINDIISLDITVSGIGGGVGGVCGAGYTRTQFSFWLWHANQNNLATAISFTAVGKWK